MSREDQHFRLRLPADLRQKVETAAAESRRSLTAEILARLEASFAPAKKLLSDDDGRPLIPDPAPGLSEDLNNFARVVAQAADSARKDGKRLVLEFREVGPPDP